ncbi:MAG: sugar transferase [Bdellovibrionota bacterium]|jgi:exopolysaccharide biosynthesis polyprenyl glycosylphosphotransferase
MLKENWRTISRIERVGDFLIIIASFFIAYHGRESLLFWNDVFGFGLPFEGFHLAPMKDYAFILVIALILYGLLLQMLGAYTSMRFRTSLELFGISLLSSVVVFFGLAATLFLLKLDLSRSFILLFCTLVGLSLAAERAVVLEILRFWRKRGMNFRSVIIAGVGEQAIQLANEIAKRPELGIRIRGFADLENDVARSTARGEFFREALRVSGYCQRIGRILCGNKSVKQALKDYAIDEVIFTDMLQVMSEVRELIDVCSEQGIRTTLAADLFSVGLARSRLSYFGSMPLIHFETPPGDRWELSVKRLIDVVVSLVLMIVLAPLLLGIALVVRFSSPGPIFFVQRRVGRSGRFFNLYKFRSMVDGAEHQRDALEGRNEMDGPVFKISHDPRVTGVGSFLRRYSLDELPQLLNVLKGDMSLVGPRPPVPGEVNMYERRDRRRLSMRPGLTCTWQVSGRNTITDFDDWVKMDLAYIDNWSLSLDFALLLKTIPAVLSGHGAR